MVRNMGVARDLGLLRVPAGVLVDARDLDDLPENRVVLICTGSQGEPLSALSRMANRDHADPHRATATRSSSPPAWCPATRTRCSASSTACRGGAPPCVHKGNAQVHVSGHAPAGELLYVLNVTRPANLMPVHGEWRHLRAHAALAGLTGVPASSIVLADDGVVVDLVDGRAQITGTSRAATCTWTGSAVGDVGEVGAEGPAHPRRRGFITVTVVVDAASGKVVGGPEISARGFTDADGAFDEAAPLVEEALERAAGRGRRPTRTQLQQLVRRTVGRWVNDTYRRRPMIVPVVVEV